MVSATRRNVLNFDGVRNEIIRRHVDDFYHELRSDLRDTYRTYWKHGLNKKWFMWDVRNNEAATRKQFEILYGLLGHIHVVILFAVNKQLKLVPMQKLGGLEKLNHSKQWIAEKAQQYDIDLDIIRNYVKNWFWRNKRFKLDI